MLLDDFNHTIEFWIKELDQYDFMQLCAKPCENSWSLGQLYMHLINDTCYYVEQMRICISNNENALEEAADFAKMIFRNNGFPDEIIEGAPSNACIPQPGNKEQLLNSLLKIKDDINFIAKLIFEGRFSGKTKHPGLNYFSAKEWLQFADIHFRHHLRQKKRIDDFLKAVFNR